MSAAKQVRSLIGFKMVSQKKVQHQQPGGMSGILLANRDNQIPTVRILNANMAKSTTVNQRLKIFDTIEAMGVERNATTFTLAAELLEPERESSKYIIGTLLRIMSSNHDIVPDDRFLRKAIDCAATLDQATLAYKMSPNASLSLRLSLQNKQISLERKASDNKNKRFPRKKLRK